MPVYPNHIIPFIGKDLVWNNCLSGDTVCITRTDHNNRDQHFLGVVVKLERLPNCYMMHFDIVEMYEGT